MEVLIFFKIFIYEFFTKGFVHKWKGTLMHKFLVFSAKNRKSSRIRSH